MGQLFFSPRLAFYQNVFGKEVPLNKIDKRFRMKLLRHRHHSAFRDDDIFRVAPIPPESKIPSGSKYRFGHPSIRAL